MPLATTNNATVEVVHVTVLSEKSFEDTRDALIRDVPELDRALLGLMAAGQSTKVEQSRTTGPKLWIFETRDHGALLAAEGQAKKAMQFEIGNPLTAALMTRHRLAAGLYAPLRVILYENDQGRVIFEYDKPSSQFSQFGNDDVNKTALGLDDELERALLKAAGHPVMV